MKIRAFIPLVAAVLLALPQFCLAGQRVSVSVESANVRTGPGTKYEIVWKGVEKHYPLLILDQAGSWYYVKDFENDTGWIFKKLVKKTQTVITKKQRCNVRKGPGAKKPLAFVVDSGVPFKVLTRKGNWIQVQHADGDKGWIYKFLVW
ncbi:SH3 domain-containing protein [Desulfoluna sp.]|uniref:SH3 domain-containing protein n=1 Tax=Desulfoluna sp. TaxID=2045199 RepID=UPI0026117F7B|nr:SH3 domain-containing protein [Desulfoluna sp.]